MLTRQRAQEAELRRLARVKQAAPTGAQALGPELVSFYKTAVQKRQTKLQKIAACWTALVPELLNEHCALEGLSRGTLTVMVDSAPYLYELKQLLLAGLEQQLIAASSGAGLRKIVLKRGRWYETDGGGGSKVKFTP